MSGRVEVVRVAPERFGAEVRDRLRQGRPEGGAPRGGNLVALWAVGDAQADGEELEAVFEAAGEIVRVRAPKVQGLVWPSEAGVGVTRAEEVRLRALAPAGDGRYALGPARPVWASGAFRFPIGPVRGDVMESVGLTLTAMGDEVLALRVDLGYKLRYVTRAAVGRPVGEAVRVVERATATSTVAHALAFCQAVEAAQGIALSPRAATLRSVLAEIERVHSHLYDLASLASSTGLPTAQQELMAARESVLRAAAALTGHRYMRGMVVPGGLGADPGDAAWRGSVERVVAIVPGVERVFAQLNQTPSFLDRLNAAGVVLVQEAEDAGALGPVGRASGAGPDDRRYRPYAGYVGHPPSPLPHEHTGDAWARWRVKTAELRASCLWLDQASERLSRLKASAPRAASAPGWGLGLVEGPRGEIAYAASVDASGRATGVWARTASMRNWALLPAAVARRNVLQDVPIIDASFALSAAGSDM